MAAETRVPSESSRLPDKTPKSGSDPRGASWDGRLIPPVFGFLLLTGVALWTMWLGYIEPAEPPVPPMPRWWVSPIEFNSNLRLPVIEGALNCVHSTPDGQKIWVVGDGGLILHSPNAGRTWVRQGDNVSSEPVPLPFAPVPGLIEPVPAPKPVEERKAEPDPKKAAAGAAAARNHPQAFAQIPPEKKEVPGAVKAPVDNKQKQAQQNLAAQPNPAIQQNIPAADAPPAAPDRAGVTDQVRYRNWLGVGFDADGVNGFAVCYSGTVIRTKDGGNKWEVTQTLPRQLKDMDGLFGMFGVDSDHPEYLCIRVAGNELRTKDLGVTFETRAGHDVRPDFAPYPFPGDREIMSVAMTGMQPQSFRLYVKPFVGNPVAGGPNGAPKEMLLNVHSTPAHGRYFVGINGGLLWEPAEEKGVNLRTRPSVTGKIYSLWVPPEKSDAPLWLCGADGLLMRSTDSGVNWISRSRPKPIDDAVAPTWFTLPPPLYYPAAIALFIWMLSIHLSKLPPESEGPAAGDQKDPRTGERFPKGFQPDKPVESEKDDTLNFKEISEGLSRFLRNQDTKPPLSIAITGAWGSGKSSIMGLLKRKLEQHDCPVVWFNAWHHQKEASLLAALLQNLNLQAIWPWYTLKGIRLRLELVRRKLVPTIWIPAVLLACVFFGWVWAKPNSPLLFWKDIGDLASGTTKDNSDAAGKFVSLLLSLIGLGGVGASSRWLWNAAKGLGVDPAKLVQDAQSSSLATSRDQISFRYQFARDFARLTGILRDAFQTRITVFIDDLDRCEPTQVREILEAVNFLVSSGDCFIVMGMDYERVKTCVGQGFRDSVIEADGLTDKDPILRENARAALNKFAQRYMEKLVNIVVPVPQSDDERLKDLVAKADDEKPNTGGTTANLEEASGPVTMSIRAANSGVVTNAGIVSTTNTGTGTHTASSTGAGTGDGTSSGESTETNRRRRTVLAAMAIVALGILCYWGGHNLGASFVAPKPTPRTPVGETIRVKLWGKTLLVRSIDHLWTVEFEQTKPVDPNLPPVPPPSDNYAYQPNQAKATTSSVTLQSLWGSVLAALVPLSIALGWFIMSKALSKEWVEKDRVEFTQSMRVWYPIYSVRRDDIQGDHRATPRSIKRFANRARYYAMRARRGTVSNQPEVADARLVALAAIDDYFAGLSQLLNSRKNADDMWNIVQNAEAYPSVVAQADPLHPIWTTIENHKQVFNDTWPPTLEEVKFIRGLAQGIHLT